MGRRNVNIKSVKQCTAHQKATALAMELARTPSEGLNQVNAAESKFNKNKFKGGVWDTFRLLLEYCRDSLLGHYPSSWQSRVAVLTTIVYTVSPIDLLPDWIPGIGFLDDYLVITACAHCIADDLANYCVWKEQQDKEARRAAAEEEAAAAAVKVQPEKKEVDWDEIVQKRAGYVKAKADYNEEDTVLPLDDDDDDLDSLADIHSDSTESTNSTEFVDAVSENDDVPIEHNV